MTVRAGTPGAIQAPPSQAGYLGQGIAYPLATDGKGRLALSWGLDAVADAMESIMATEPGERVMQPDYGANQGTFDPVDPGRQKAAIERTVGEHEPRVDEITDLDVRLGQTPIEQVVDVSYSVQRQVTPQTLTYPYFSTGTTTERTDG